MKTKFYSAFLVVLSIACNSLRAQNTFPSTGAAGIGTTTPNTSSLLEIKSTAKGFLMPRMTKAQRDAITSPATGLLIYQTNSTPGFYYYNGTAWAAISLKGWSLTGNANTNSLTNFIGTTDNKPLNFRVNNTNAGTIQTDGQIFLGLSAGVINTGLYNTAVGGYALQSNTSGSYNTANGNQALDSNTTGIWNTATGFRSLYSNKTGQANTANGESALYANATGNYNTAMGLEALYYDSVGSGNTAIGQDALFNNITGDENTATGTEALSINAAGSYNTADGYFAGPNVDGLSNTTAIGENATTTADNQVRIGDNYATSIGGYVNWSNISDGRVKKNIKPNVPGLTFINKLQPITYNLNLDAADKIIQRSTIKDKDARLNEEVRQGKAIQLSQFELNARKAKEQIVYTGFIAQDVEKAARSLNYDFSGVDAAKNNKDLYGLRYADFVVPLVKAVQELSNMNDAKDASIDTLKLMLTAQQNEIDELKAMIVSNQSTVLSSASLQQNIPNPFTHTTSIGYTLPQKFTNAQIVITDKNGKTLKAIPVSGSGKGSLNVDASALSSGAYQYSLIVDGKLIATKQMILAK